MALDRRLSNVVPQVANTQPMTVGRVVFSGNITPHHATDGFGNQFVVGGGGGLADAFDKKKALQTGGARFDEGKSRVDLIPAEVLLLLGDIYEMGARKYDASNWRKGMKWSKVYGPLFRHLLKFWMGQKDDEESQKLHIMHVIWNAVALALYCIKPEYKRFDDRQDPVNIVDMDEEDRQNLYV